MRKLGTSSSSTFLRFLHDHTIWALGILHFLGMFLILDNIFFGPKNQSKAGRTICSLVCKIYRKVRGEYASEVVSRVAPLGILVTHDYLDHEGAIPIPATFAIDLSERITESVDSGDHAADNNSRSGDFSPGD